MIPIHCSLVLMMLLSNTNGDTDSTAKPSKQTKSHRKSIVSEFWKNHRLGIDSREAKSNNEPIFSEPNANNNEQFFSEPNANNNDQYEQMPNTIHITAVPAAPGVFHGGIGGVPGQYPIGINSFGGIGGLGGVGGLGGIGGVGGVGGVEGLGGVGGGWHGHSPWPSYAVSSHGHHGYHHGGGGHHHQHQRPIYLINKRVDWFSWFIPLLFLLGAPLLLGIVLIPVVLKSIIFLLQILRNLGILLPITAALSGAALSGNAVASLTQQA